MRFGKRWQSAEFLQAGGIYLPACTCDWFDRPRSAKTQSLAMLPVVQVAKN